MFFSAKTTSLAIATLLLSSPAFAGDSLATPQSSHARRDAANDVHSPVTLEPVIPHGIDQNDLKILDLDKDVALAWAGTPSGMSKRDNSVLSQAQFKFAYPVVPLDHAEYVTEVKCAEGKLSARLGQTAHDYAKKQWSNAKDIVFVTSVDSCGLKNANEYFRASGVAFDDNAKTFSASGSPVSYSDVALAVKLNWGKAGSQPLKRAADKRDFFESDAVQPRAYEKFRTSWNAFLQDDWALGTDKSSPWDKAALLAKWSKSDGIFDEAWKYGRAIRQQAGRIGNRLLGRGLSKSDLVVRDTAEWGMALYCVDCGYRGQAEVWGEIDADVFRFKVNRVRVGIKGDMHAGMTLGLDSFIKIERSFNQNFRQALPGGFRIPFLVAVGSFLSFGVEARAGLEASGQALIGGDVHWEGMDMMVDVLESDYSYSRGPSPRGVSRAEAAGQLKLKARLAMPMRLGVGINILDGKWTADAGMEEVPALNSGGFFKGQVSRAPDGRITGGIEGSCYGIDWSVFMTNERNAFLRATGIGEKLFPIMDPKRDAPIGRSCIGYQRRDKA